MHNLGDYHDLIVFHFLASFFRSGVPSHSCFPCRLQYLTAQHHPLPYFILITKMSLPESNGKTVLVTGINGYIASVLGLDLLKKGYSLRGTSRRAASAEALVKGPFAPYIDRVKIYEVPDMTIDGAFDEAAKGIISQTQPLPRNSRHRSTC